MLFDALAIRSVALNTLISQQRFALSLTGRSADKQATAAIPHVARTTLSVPVSRAIADASALCLEKYGEVPAVKIHGDASRSILCVESHIYFIALELLKNALKATVDKHRLARVVPEVEVAVGIEVRAFASTQVQPSQHFFSRAISCKCVFAMKDRGSANCING